MFQALYVRNIFFCRGVGDVRGRCTQLWNFCHSEKSKFARDLRFMMSMQTDHWASGLCPSWFTEFKSLFEKFPKILEYLCSGLIFMQHLNTPLFFDDFFFRRRGVSLPKAMDKTEFSCIANGQWPIFQNRGEWGFFVSKTSQSKHSNSPISS